MRKFIFSAVLSLAALTGFCQTTTENGIIYIAHPYIDVVNKSVQAYRDRDMAANATFFADTAKFWASGMPKPIPIAEAMKDWATDFDFYTDINLTPVGYPDYLHYKDQDQKYVQSWWRWKGKSKKTGQMVTIDFVQFDRFNSDGKIDNEAVYGDFSKLVKN